MKIIKSLEQSDLLNKAWTKQLKMKQKNKGECLGMLLGILGAISLGNLLTGKDTIRAGKGTIRVGKDFKCHLIL